jgi:hypothetical protein
VSPHTTVKKNRALNEFPFRDIGVGTVFLAFSSLFGRSFAVSAIPLITALLWIISFLLLYILILRKYGTFLAILAFLSLSLPPAMWKLHNVLLTEVYLRGLFALGLCSLLLIHTDHRKFLRYALLTLFAILVMAHFKVQWMLLAPLLLVAMLTHTLPARQWKQSLILTLATLVIPLSLIAVHWIGWGQPVITGGVGVHLAKTTRGSFLAFTCERGTLTGSTIPLCEHPRKHVFRLHSIYMRGGPDLSSGQVVRSLDAQVVPYLASRPAWVLRRVRNGLRSLSIFPPLRDSPFSVLLDIAVFSVLVFGLIRRETRMIAAYTIGLWLIPIVGNIVSLGARRYHLPMAGLPLIGCMLVLASSLSLPVLKKWASGVVSGFSNVFRVLGLPHLGK